MKLLRGLVSLVLVSSLLLVLATGQCLADGEAPPALTLTKAVDYAVTFAQS